MSISVKVGWDDGHEPPTMVMCPPLFLSTAIKNNVFMRNEKVDRDRAVRQYRRIRLVLEALGRRVLEIPPKDGLQDQVYVANIAVAIKPYIVLANYKAPGRSGEVPVAKKFFEKLGYDTVQPPYHFEGEADLKELEKGLYIGGYGQFTDRRALDWISEKCGVEIVKVRETNEKLYHLDCCLMPINPGTILVTPGSLDAPSIRELEKYAEVVMTPKGVEVAGITNGVRVPEKRMYLTGTLVPEDKAYVKAMDWLDEFCDRMGWAKLPLDTDAFDASGADLSCCCMHLTFAPNEP